MNLGEGEFRTNIGGLAASLDPGADAVLLMRQTWRVVDRMVDLSFPGEQWNKTRDETSIRVAFGVWQTWAPVHTLPGCSPWGSF